MSIVTRVSEIMTSDGIVTVEAGASCHDAVARMVRNKIRHLPVVERTGALCAGGRLREQAPALLGRRRSKRRACKSYTQAIQRGQDAPLAHEDALQSLALRKVYQEHADQHGEEPLSRNAGDREDCSGGDEQEPGQVPGEAPQRPWHMRRPLALEVVDRQGEHHAEHDGQ